MVFQRHLEEYDRAWTHRAVEDDELCGTPASRPLPNNRKQYTLFCLPPDSLALYKLPIPHFTPVTRCPAPQSLGHDIRPWWPHLTHAVTTMYTVTTGEREHTPTVDQRSVALRLQYCVYMYVCVCVWEGTGNVKTEHTSYSSTSPHSSHNTQRCCRQYHTLYSTCAVFMALLVAHTPRHVPTPLAHISRRSYLSVGDVHSQVDVSKATAANLPHESILSADLELGLTTAPTTRHCRPYH